jgi:hypothetical protein
MSAHKKIIPNQCVLLKNQVRQRDRHLCWKVWTISNLQQLKFGCIRYMSSNFIRSSDWLVPQKILIQISVLGEDLKCREIGKYVWKCEPVSNHNSNFWWTYMSPNLHWKLRPNSLKNNSKSVQLRKESSHTVSWKLCAQVCNSISNFDESTQFPISSQAQTKYLFFSIQYFVLCNNL